MRPDRARVLKILSRLGFFDSIRDPFFAGIDSINAGQTAFFAVLPVVYSSYYKLVDYLQSS